MSQFINNLSIKNKLVFVILFVTLIAIGIGFTFAIYSNIRIFREDTINNSVINAKFIGYYSVPALAFYDGNGAEEILAKLQIFPSIKSAHIFDDHGNLFASFEKVKSNNIQYPGSESKSYFSGDNLFVSEPIIYRDQNYGTIILNISAEALNRKIVNYLIQMISTMVVVMILAYFFSIKLQTFISKPVLKLSEAMEKVSSQTDFSIRVEKPGNDEIGMLYDGFNNMLSQIQMRERERDEAGMALQAGEDRYRILFNSGYDAVFVFQIKDTSAGQFIEVNDVACNRLEYSKEQILTLLPGQIDKNYNAEEEKIRLAELLDKKHVIYEQEHMTRSGKTIPVEITARLFEFNDLPTVLIIARDITDRKHAEQELIKHRHHLEELVEERTLKLKSINEQLELEIIEKKRAEEALKNHSQLLEAANKELESFSYSVSHDLRAPLRAIDGFSRVLVEEYGEKLDKEGNRVLNIIISNTKKMGQLIDDLLTFSRLGRKEMGYSEINVNDLVEEVNQDIIMHSKGRRIEIITGELGVIYGDRSMIRQIFFNLISNAVKFSSGRDISIVEIGKIEINRDEIYFIKDNGVGFDMKYSSKLFGVFQRLHGAEEFEGTGVGLALVKRIIHRHGGKIWAESEVDNGATFFFSFPERKLIEMHA